jgi:hypothetical protein
MGPHARLGFDACQHACIRRNRTWDACRGTNLWWRRSISDAPSGAYTMHSFWRRARCPIHHLPSPISQDIRISSNRISLSAAPTTEVDRRSYRMQFLQAPPTSKAWRGFPIIGCLSVLRPIAFGRRTEPPSVGTRVRRSSTTSATSRSAASIERRHGSGDPRVGKLSICTQTRRSLLIANSP